jgi:hypothetical protein
MYRLNRRFHRMLAKGKPAGKTLVAVARELAGFVWAASIPPQPRKKESLHPLASRTYFGGRSRRMKAGTIQRTRAAALRQGSSASWIRDLRPRCLSTENGHAALRSAQPAHMRMTRRRSVLPRPSSAAPKEDSKH